MRGREQFQRYKIFIRLLEYLFYLLPSNIAEIIWTCVDSWRGRIALTIRYVIARKLSKKCGDVVFIGPQVHIRNWKGLDLGTNISIQKGCYIDAIGGIIIGNNVSIAHYTSILSSNHRWEDIRIPIRDNVEKLEKVKIGDDIWIGCGCRILAGVAVGRRSIVAAGSVVTKNVYSGSLVGGVPAQVIKKIQDE